ncbi:MAG: hypothetical protein AAGJ82_13770, partial [Bacteroidota bacterium]
SKQKKQQQLQEKVKAKAEQIQQLQADIEAHQKQLTALDQDINTAVTNIENTKNDFFASYQHLVTQIEGDVEKMQTHLK